MEALQITWFLLVGVLIIGYAILDGFDLGVGMLHLFLAKDDRERRVMLNAIGPVWDGNEVWLLAAGGAIFAAFPMVYATVFSGFYLALMLLLAALIFRAVSMEFRSKEDAPAWRRGWDLAFAAGSFLPALLFGVAIGNIMRGVPLDADGEYAGSFFTLLNPFAVLVGLVAVAMFLMQGAVWLRIRAGAPIRERADRVARGAFFAFVALWLAATFASRAAAPLLWTAWSSPLAWLVPAVFAAAALAFPFVLSKGRPGAAFALSSIMIAATIGIAGIGLFPNMVPALGDPSRSLTIFNASSSELTLRTMFIIAAIGVPIVLAYTLWIYRRFFGPVVIDEHSY